MVDALLAAKRDVVPLVMNSLPMNALVAENADVDALPVVLVLVNVAPVAERAVVEALVVYSVPETVRLVVDALPSDEDAEIKLVVEAVVMFAITAAIKVEVLLVMTDEVAKIFCAKRLRNLSVEDPRDPERSLNGVVLPEITSLSVGVVVPIPMNPREVIANSDAPVEDATLNGSSTVEDDDCTLRANEDDDAFTPRTTPLSNNVDVVRVVGVSHRVAKPS